MNKDQRSQFRDAKLLPLLIKFSVPSTIVALSSILLNTTDRYFIGQAMGRVGIGSIATIYPLIVLGDALGMFFNAGGSSLVSIQLGQDNLEDARKTLGACIYTVIVVGIVYTILGFTFLEPLVRFLGATDSNINYVKDYCFFFLPSVTFQMAFWSFCAFVRSEGNPIMSMMINFASIIVNVILDYLFVIVLKWEMKGAALATSFANFVPAMLLLYHFYKSDILTLKNKYISWDFSIVKRMFSTGFSSFSNEFLYGTYILVLNVQLLKYGGEIALISLGIMTILRSFINTSYSGLNQGRQPIISFNWGAKNFKRVKDTFILSLIISGISSVFLVGIVVLLSDKIVQIFIKNDSEVVEYTSQAIRYHLMYMTGTAIYLCCAGYFQAIRKGFITTRLIFLRLVVLSIPLAYILPLKFGAMGVLISFPIADCTTALVAGYLMWKEVKLLDRKYMRHEMIKRYLKLNRPIE
ncbi:MATE family efflux transporter [Fusobacterium perfoetens]|uniref:MATE family efflux transporter n=1 Tax=Fusobacterium perfoetens TaxID=852 RepID=UPI00047FDB03|nr:MATE family efflux transporter [Fusobacterium perfoetens]